ncbi:methyl-accepting chemotaxis protein [Extensimonas sp. H3M7-6]|uniref:methyl-accepting chemotaxis protein n=1 Tax=Extensimonas soli TaxID=3031322 RepID=UPI0023DCA66C|nr:methyl-accepting chemotaxis protein [Extensimonas sp. H3M7-6]MDF1481695.1 methyl-accepting chemotaxis protein [Extensimonas sp. H3M7-6]
MLNNIRITTRFASFIAIYWVSFVLVLAVSLWGLINARDSLKEVHEQAMRRALLAEGSIAYTVQNRLQVLLAFQHAPDSPLAAVHDHPVNEHLDAIAATRAKANEEIKALEAGISDPQEQQLFAATQGPRAAWRDKLDEAIRAIAAGDFSPQVMAKFLAAGRNEGEAVGQTLRALRDYQTARAQKAAQRAQDRFEFSLIFFALATVLGGSAASYLSLTTLGRLRSGFRQAGDVAGAIARNDLTHAVDDDSKDEIGVLLRHIETMRRNLGGVIGQVRVGSDAVASAASQVAAGTQDLSSRTEAQASSLEQTAAATEELASTVQHNADNAQQASQLAASATDAARRGGQVVAQVVDTMEAISDSSRKIADIIGVIDGIAFQTNILALNAAVEAARAGEQGRGFAVVASEVRNLAGRSAEAAKEVRALISESVEKVGAGNEQVSVAGQTMQEIVAGIQRVSDIVGEIAAASREQSGGIAQINQAVTHLDSVTQQNAALVEQTSAASNALQEQARQLAALAAAFKLEAQGGGWAEGMAARATGRLSAGSIPRAASPAPAALHAATEHPRLQ